MTGEMPVRPEPGETETTTSYASRLARANGFRNLQRFCGFVGVTLIDLAAGRESALARFSVLGSVDVHRLRRTATFDRRDGRFQVGREIMSHMDVRRRDIAFCPHCVAEDLDAPSMLMPEERSWQRLAWRFLPITVCREHGVRLISVRLPAALQNGDYASALEWCVEAREMQERSEAAVFSPRQAYLSDRLHGRATPLDEFVDGLRWYAAARLFEVIGAADLFPGMIRWRRVRADLDPAATADRGFDILSAGEDAFRRWTVGRIEASRQDTGVLWPGARSIFGDLADTLERTPDPAYDRVRSILIDAALGRLPLGAGESFLGRSLQERRFHSVRSAASAATVDVETMTRLLAAEGLVDPCDDLGPDRVTIPAAQADRIAEDWRNRIPAAEAARILGLPPAQARGIDRLTSLSRFPSADGRVGDGAFDRREVLGLKKRMLDGTERADEPDEAMITFEDCLRCLHVPVADLVGMVGDRRITWRGRIVSVKGLAGLVFDREEMRALAAKAEDGGLSIVEAARHVGMHKTTLSHFLKVGAIEWRKARNPHNGKMVTALLPEALDAFARKYVKIGDLARELDTDKAALKRELTAWGIEPACDMSLARTAIYLRADLEPIFNGLRRKAA